MVIWQYFIRLSTYKFLLCTTETVYFQNYLINFSMVRISLYPTVPEYQSGVFDWLFKNEFPLARENFS